MVQQKIELTQHNDHQLGVCLWQDEVTLDAHLCDPALCNKSSFDSPSRVFLGGRQHNFQQIFINSFANRRDCKQRRIYTTVPRNK